MPAYKDVFAAINIDGKPLDEYQVQENDERKEVSCWIPSQVGKEFTISYKNSSLDKEIGLEVSLDGCMTNNLYLPPQYQGTVSGSEISLTMERPFLFSNGKLVDDDDLRDEMPNSNDLGTITLSFREGRKTGVASETANENYYDSIPGNAIPEQRQIPERGKKGIQACIGLGPSKARTQGKIIKFEYTNNITRIVFRYRPLDYLQAQGIAPPPPPPPQPRPASPSPQRVTTAETVKRKRVDDTGSQAGPSKAKRTQTERKKLADIEISDDEDIEKLQALRARIDKALAKKNVRVKKEIKAERTAVLSKGDVIDLT